MRVIILCLFVYLNCVLTKTITKSLTESMGQEVIEIGSPLKDLPDGLEEEPSAEKDDDDVTTVSVQPATKKEVKKTTTADGRRKLKDVDKIDSISRNQEEEEERVEKELADIYKDSNGGVMICERLLVEAGFA
ncbi:uncharacterized protein [Choristoneura fumiferana]|uniref:uncharacterized protein n=1 Tax=Choristoneura fumiferana TaxID=7141 RepID=UPI003D15CA27